MFCKFSKISIFNVLVLIFLLTSCNSNKSELEKQIEQIPIESEIVRFDQIFFQSPLDSLDIIKGQFPYFFTSNLEDNFWIAKKQDSLFGELNKEVNREFKDLEVLNLDLIKFFQHVKYYFPDQSSSKKVITLVSEVDTQAKAIYADTLVLISLDTYLGQDHKFYSGFAHYLRPEFNKTSILPDLARNFVMQNMKAPNDRTFISSMIFQGKILYGQELLLPWVDKNLLIGYTPEQIQWCEDNQQQIWRYFLENEYLFSSDSKLAKRFVDPAPFSKFYLEIDQQAPGKVGAWIGWQIVDSYMKNNNVTLQELLNSSNEDIFQKSKYKPKK
ncbi:gliding motility lipoprotein GldB [Myroides sp. LJL119]